MESEQQINNGSNHSKDHNNEQKKNDNKSNDNRIEQNCRICLNQITNRSLTDTCRHQFCFNCLRQWSKRHNKCPFYRRIYRNVLNNVRSETLFMSDQFPIMVIRTRI